ncbi:MAG TPA: SNF2-related protein [Anaerolineales bacterium]
MTTTPQLRSWKPRSYQKVGVKRMVSQACLGLLMKPGRGKTSVVLMAKRILQDAGYVKKTLVICPIRPMYNVWPKEPKKYEEFQHFKVNILHGKDKEAELKDDNADIYVVNPEGLEWLFGATIVKTDKGNKVVLDPVRVAYVTSKFQLLVVDESTKFKNYKSNRFKLMKQVIKKFKRRCIMTGSIRPKGLMDLFGQIYILDEGASLGQYITHYRQKYFYPSGFGGYEWSPKDNALEQIVEKLAPLCHVVDDAPEDLPRLLPDDIFIELSPSDRKIYDEMEDKLMIEAVEGKIVAANAAVASSKCRQIAAGAIYNGDGTYTRLHNSKYEALEDLIEQLAGSPLLVTYEYGFDADWLDKMGIPNITRLTPKEGANMIEKFGRGEIPVLAGNPKSISLGIDGLQHACADIAMLGITWDLLDYEQVIQRVQRSGNPNAVVTLHRILARNTKDEQVAKVLGVRDTEQVDFLRLLRLRSDSQSLLTLENH